MIRRITVLAALLGALATPLAQAQSTAYPTKPIRLIVPFTAGGASDIVGRLIAKELQVAFGQPVVVENKPGANTNIANGEVARAEPDGYTLLMATNLIISNPLLYKNVPYKQEQFTPVARLFNLPLVLDASTKLPVNTVKELVTYAKAHPGELNYGTTGLGSTPHMFMEQFKKLTGTEIAHIPFKGSAPILQEMMAGRVQMAIDGLPGALTQYKAGNVKILAAVTEERLPQLPDTPTLKELGYPIVSSSWYGILVPAGTPKPIVVKLNSEIRRITNSSEFRQQLASAGVTPPPDSSPEEFAAFLERDAEFWKKLIEPMNLKLD